MGYHSCQIITGENIGTCSLNVIHCHRHKDDEHHGHDLHHCHKDDDHHDDHDDDDHHDHHGKQRWALALDCDWSNQVCLSVLYNNFLVNR